MKYSHRTVTIFLVAMFLIVGSGRSLAVEYPILARCTGESVRLREDPSTNAKIIGKVDLGFLYVLDETAVEGEVWYEVDHPTQKGTAWIFGKYVDIDYYLEGIAPETRLATRLAWQVRITFGDTLEKAHVLFGKPKKQSKTMTWIEGLGRRLPDITLTWPTHTAQYVDGGLTMVKVTKGSLPFGTFRIGDSASNVRDLLGEPSEDSEEGWLSYELAPVNTLSFKERNGKITAMEYISWFD